VALSNYGPAGIEETRQNAIDAADSAYTTAVNTATSNYDSAVATANTTYYTSLCGNAEGVAPYGAGTPADAWTSAVDGANTAFTTGEQAAYTTYDAAMQIYNLSEMQYQEDALNGLSTMPPDPLRAAKDYSVDVAALDVNHASAVGGAWVGWASAERAADTLRDNAIINAEYQRGKDLLDASRNLAEDSYAGDMIDIQADYAIASLTKQAEISGDAADAENSFELAEHAAGAFAAQATNLATKNREEPAGVTVPLHDVHDREVGKEFTALIAASTRFVVRSESAVQAKPEDAGVVGH